ncbi:hypothetical protein ABFX02_08G197600 [Erythranthe guttata]
MDISNTTSHTTVEPEETNPTFSTNQQMGHTAAPPETSHDIPAAEDLSAAAAAQPVGQGVIKRRRIRTHVRSRISGEACGGGGGGGGGEESSTDDDDEKAEVGKKIAALKRIVPGGERLGMEELFEETAEYILKLECQVQLLRFLAAFLQRSDEYKNRKHGS